jgi:formate-dependent nitrite reductase membrane component NrfD
MFSSYIVWYLFLAGAGSGAYVIAATYRIFWGFHDRDDHHGRHTIMRGGFIFGPALVALGTVFLIFDLGSPEKAYTLFLNTSFSLLTLGSWFILLFCLSAVFYLLVQYYAEKDSFIFIRRVVRVISLLLAICVMVYTGLFVAGMPSMPFLHTPLVVALFIISSLSTGVSVIMIYGFLQQQQRAMLFGLETMHKLEELFILLELVVLCPLILSMYFGTDLTRISVELLLFGEGMQPFLIGTVLLGLVLPFLIHLAVRYATRPVAWTISALCTFVAGFFLRHSLLSAGLHVDLLKYLSG